MDNPETKAFTIHLCGKNETSGEEVSVKTLRYSVLAAQVKSWKYMIAGEDDPIILLEDGSLKFIFLLAAAVYATLVADIGIMREGKYNVSVEAHKKWYSDLSSWIKNTGFKCQILGEGQVIDSITRETAIKESPKGSSIILSRFLQGEILDMGGQTSPNMHVQTATGKPLIIKITRKQVSELKESVIYKRRIMRVTYKYNPTTGEASDYEFQEFISPKKLDKSKLGALIKETTKIWKDVPDHVEWVRQQRGDDKQ